MRRLDETSKLTLVIGFLLRCTSLPTLVPRSRYREEHRQHRALHHRIASHRTIEGVRVAVLREDRCGGGVERRERVECALEWRGARARAMACSLFLRMALAACSLAPGSCALGLGSQCETCFGKFQGGVLPHINKQNPVSKDVSAHAFAPYAEAKSFKSMGGAAKQQPKTAAGKVKPNDPCSCGSAKKFKKCCGDPSKK